MSDPQAVAPRRCRSCFYESCLTFIVLSSFSVNGLFLRGFISSNMYLQLDLGLG